MWKQARAATNHLETAPNKKSGTYYLDNAPLVINSTFHDSYKSLFTSKWSKGSGEDLMTYLDGSARPAVSEYEHCLIQMFILPRRKFGLPFS